MPQNQIETYLSGGKDGKGSDIRICVGHLKEHRKGRLPTTEKRGTGVFLLYNTADDPLNIEENYQVCLRLIPLFHWVNLTRVTLLWCVCVRACVRVCMLAIAHMAVCWGV